MAQVKALIGNIKGKPGKDGSENQIYSYDETPIGTWVGGETIYRKVVSCGTLPNNNIKTVASGISNLNEVISISGISYSPSSNCWSPIPYASSSNGTVFMSGATINIRTDGNVSSYTKTYVIIEYTKK